MICPNILVTGCNRGIGLEFIKQLSRTSLAKKVIATCRSPHEAGELQEVAAQNPSVVYVLKLEVTAEESYEQFNNHVKDIVGDEGLNVLLHNAGYAPRSGKIKVATWKEMEKTMAINAIAPLMLTKTLLPLLKEAAKCSTDASLMSVRKAAIINISSIAGSISDNGSGGVYPYRASKAALNAIMKSLSLDLKPYNILSICLHPGWVRTDMGGHNARLTTEQSVASMLKVLQNLREENSGQFLREDGTIIPW